MEHQYNPRSPAVKRLMREAQELSESTSEYFAQPLSDNLFEWHFTVRGPTDSDFDGGVYHGRILLPAEYPMKPPNVIFLTPNGRFETGKKICLSISGYHPESWQPSWSIRTALLAIIGFMPTPGHGTIGSLEYRPEERRKLAQKSVSFCCEECSPGGQPVVNLLKPPETNHSASEKAAAEAKEIIKSMSMKGEDERSVSEEKTVIEETEAEKERRLRKEASKRAQDRFRLKIQARTPQLIAELTNSINNQPQQQRQQQQAPAAAPANNATTRTAPPTAAAAGRAAPAAQPHRFNSFDLLIAIIVIVIAVLLFRRFSSSSPIDIDSISKKMT